MFDLQTIVDAYKAQQIQIPYRKILFIIKMNNQKQIAERGNCIETCLKSRIKQLSKYIQFTQIVNEKLKQQK
ncbi:unnamed protein product [Paramecium sonneborni]|uniref:Uncharacterized protein n=1 Tax=Paramecium sonneborni TaxID=65129 RepID=A0A8S1L3I2_9CILI|nr:unnamed protein product [Paramecium sonneborni]